jgi:hypothetical protein
MSDLTSALRQMRKFGAVLAWVVARHNRTLDELWAECPHGYWMLWLASCLGVDRHLTVLAACDCAESALIHVPIDENRPRVAIEAARRWAQGTATIDDARAAIFAADAAYDAAYELKRAAASYASIAAHEAAAAIEAAEYMDDPAEAVMYAAQADALAAYAYARSADKDEATAVAAAETAATASFARSAEIVRSRIGIETIASALASYSRRSI